MSHLIPCFQSVGIVQRTCRSLKLFCDLHPDVVFDSAHGGGKNGVLGLAPLVGMAKSPANVLVHPGARILGHISIMVDVCWQWNWASLVPARTLGSVFGLGLVCA